MHGRSQTTKSGSTVLAAGLIAGVCSRTATAPIDRVKVLIQISALPDRSIMNGLREIYSRGGWVSLFRGNGANVLKIGPESAIRWYIFEQLQGVGGGNHVDRFVAGALAGASAQTLVYPLELAKTRLAASMDTRILECLTRTVRYEGFAGLFRGLSASLLGIVPYAGVELAVYCSLRDHFSALPLAALWCGAISSLCAQTVTYPIQLVRTRLQAHSGAMSARQCALQVMHSEGIRGLYRGWRANMTKSIPAVSIGYLVYEHTLQYSTQFRIQYAQASPHVSQDILPDKLCDLEQAQVAVLGGTFDHLHGGHKVLLTAAAFAATHKLYIGVTADSMLKRKAYIQAMQTIQHRSQAVKTFLRNIKPELHVVVEELHDIYGPALQPDAQLLIVSKETETGALEVNKKRLELGLNPLRIHVVDLVGSLQEEKESSLENKLSSTFLRKWELMVQYLNPKWNELCKNLNVSMKSCEHWWSLILKSYCEETRHYHTVFHIEQLFRFYDRFHNRIQNHLIVQLAMWFHDIVYDPKCKDNEIQICISNRLRKNTSIPTKEFILSTIKHEDSNQILRDSFPHLISDLHMFLDFDLGILGSPSKDYELYSHAIRKEYAHLPLEDYVRGRKHVLTQFLSRPRLYYSDAFLEEFEASGRLNIERELGLLN